LDFRIIYILGQHVLNILLAYLEQGDGALTLQRWVTVTPSWPSLYISVSTHMHDVNVSVVLILEERYNAHCNSCIFHVVEGTKTQLSIFKILVYFSLIITTSI
jgi:hypothetical protein